MNDSIIIRALASKVLSYAMQQNHIENLSNVKLDNNSETDYYNLSLKITCSPEFANPVTVLIPKLIAGGKVEVGNIGLVINGEYLASLTEKCVGHYVITLFNGDPEDEDSVILAETTEEIEVLPYNEWSGVYVRPQILSSFSMPNHPAIKELLPVCAEVLNKWTKDPSILGYETKDPNQVKLQIGAAYECLKKEQIAYSLPPASYETIGQKIRTPDEVLAQKLGTCLDLTLVYSSLLEAMRLNPLIIIMKDHAFVGCHLEDETFVECVDEDVATLSKKNADGINEILLVETTALVAGKNTSFEEAIELGNANLLNESAFMMVIDVARCRGSRILPLPARVLENGSYRIVDFGAPEKTGAKPKDLVNTGNVNVTENVLTKKQLWERKLLDLSLRNPLLNFRVTKSAVQLIAGDLGQIEDSLNEGVDFALHPIPGEVNISAGEDKIYPYAEYKELIDTVAVSEFKSKRIRTFLREADLNSSLKSLQRTAKVNAEESGSSTLFLALGFLKYFESEKSTKERYAPLILVPVGLTKKLQDKTYHMKLIEEETRVNITLLEFLRQNYGMDIGGLDPLPQDDSGIDIPLVLNTFRKAIMEKKGWDVCDYAFIGNFSFTRFLMWNDIRDPKLNIEGNKVVKSLMDGHMTWDSTIKDEDLSNTDKKKPQEMAVVLSADASQLKALELSALGESFVLHGPPGTGKSQTITNMIANALFQGKRVLFVAEKMAALSVVQNRLEKVGLGSYCLELHSNKAQKSAVLAQLERSLGNLEEDKSEAYESKAEALYELRRQLNEPVDALHEERDDGFSVYELIGLYEANIAYESKVNLTRDYVSGINRDKFEEVCISLHKLNSLNDSCGKMSEHPLKDFYVSEYSIDIRREFVDTLNEYRRSLKDAESPFKVLRTRISESIPDTREGLTWIERMIEAVDTEGEILPKLLFGYLAKENREYYEEKIKAGREYQKAREEMLQTFKPDIFDYDEVRAKQRLVEAQGKWVFAKNKDIKALVKELRFMSVKPEEITETNLSQYYDKLSLFKTVKEAAKEERDFTESFAGLYKGDETNYDLIEKSLYKAIELCNIISAFPGDEDGRSEIYSMFRKGDLLDYISDGGQVISHFRENAERRLIVEQKLISDYKMDINTYREVEGYIPFMVSKIDEYIEHSEELREYSYMCASLDTIKEENLIEVVEGLRDGTMEPADILPSYVCSFGRVAAEYYIAGDERLKSFNGAGFEQAIDRLKSISDEYMTLTKAQVASSLSKKVTEIGGDVVSKTQIGVLKKAIKSGHKAVPVRKLFDQIPSLITTLCPCMLMSPISVAQYLSPTFPKFDLVVFDEASQLPTAEAVGSMARGENVIIVGDPKQLPPTSFFMTNHENEEDRDIEDMESLLDDCLTVSMPEQYLLWHYRSRHESLIAYSNMAYYENKLYTFPSPADQVSEVKFIPVEGFYDRGKTKQNKAEAEAVVAEIMRRLADEELRKDSMGVVTFSSVQQTLIEDMLNDTLAKNPELELIAAGLEEPIFVKNLENVQGDERDVIMFSIGYGPDKDGKVGMNFGPLNQDGGWRRLNVAISRARKTMMIYSTLQPEQIDLSRTSSRGIEGLKGFLEFAKAGMEGLYVKNSANERVNHAVAEAIVAKLNESGYKAHLDVGSSKYHMDIGVVNPDEPDKYCLGILIDGENYKNSENANDRNILQPSVLEGLGWKLMRVYTIDWFDTPGRELKKILDAIKENLS